MLPSLEELAEAVKEKYQPVAYADPIKPVAPYSGYRNKSSATDLVLTVPFEYANLNSPGLLGRMFIDSKYIQVNKGTLDGNLTEYHVTIRHEGRHAATGMSDQTIIGDYPMRVLDSTAFRRPGPYDKEQEYRQAA